MTVHDMHHSESIDVAAAPPDVYDLVRRLDRMGEWSPENTGGTWVSGDGSSTGDQFEGVNQIGERQWSVVATINRAEPGVAFAFCTGPPDDVTVQWSYEMEPTESGTALTETWDVVKLPSALTDAPPERLAGRKAQVLESMRATLKSMKSTLED
jgi:hypothetical protein